MVVSKACQWVGWTEDKLVVHSVWTWVGEKDVSLAVLMGYVKVVQKDGSWAVNLAARMEMQSAGWKGDNLVGCWVVNLAAHLVCRLVEQQGALLAVSKVHLWVVRMDLKSDAGLDAHLVGL